MSVKQKKGTNTTDDDTHQVHCILGQCFASTECRGTSFDEEVGLIFLDADSDVRSNSEAHRLGEHRSGENDQRRQRPPLCYPCRSRLVVQVAPAVATNHAPKVPLVTHASETSTSTSALAGSCRWVIDSGSCIDIVGEGTISKNERRSTEEMHAPMRPKTANGEAIAS